MATQHATPPLVDPTRSDVSHAVYFSIEDALEAVQHSIDGYFNDGPATDLEDARDHLATVRRLVDALGQIGPPLPTLELEALWPTLP